MEICILTAWYLTPILVHGKVELYVSAKIASILKKKFYPILEKEKGCISKS